MAPSRITKNTALSKERVTHLIRIEPEFYKKGKQVACKNRICDLSTTTWAGLKYTLGVYFRCEVPCNRLEFMLPPTGDEIAMGSCVHPTSGVRQPFTGSPLPDMPA